MGDLVRILLLLGIAGSAVTMLGSGAAWWLDEDRKLRRLVSRALGCEPDAAIVAKGRNAAAGISLDASQVVVMRDGGAKALLYRLSALVGAELIIDGAVAARVYRGEPRRTLDRLDPQARRVTLRLVFDNAKEPDFDLDLWIPADESRREAKGPEPAIQEARTWLARVDAIMRALPTETPVRRPAEPAPPLQDDDDDDLPWDEDDDEDDGRQ